MMIFETLRISLVPLVPNPNSRGISIAKIHIKRYLILHRSSDPTIFLFLFTALLFVLRFFIAVAVTR